MKFSTSLLLLLMAGAAIAQNKTFNFGSVTGAIGNSQGSASIAYFHNWKLGKAERISVGLGGRFTSYFGSDQYFSSAPAALASDENKIDSLLLPSANVNALNIALTFGYRFSIKFSAGFSIDALGVSFGARQSGTHLSGNLGQATTAKPTSLNALLIGNNDRGTLNSEFYVRYFITEKIGIKAAFQYLFTEYTTDTEVQQIPEPNDRFRNKASMFSLGVTKMF